MPFRNGLSVSGATLLVAMGISAARAQVSPARTGTRSTQTKSSQNRTILSVELLTGKRTSGVSAQEWGRTFQKIGFSVRIRRSVLDDKPEIKERKLGRLREITVIGKLESSGKLTFPGRSFSPGEGAKLAEWLRSIEVYGAQGPPTGQPVWGLSQAQFDILFNTLREKVETEVAGQPFDAALIKMKLSPKYPVRLTSAAKDRLGQAKDPNRPVRTTLKGHSKGTALALLLSDFGLGFRPLRTPGGDIELAIESLKQTTDVWPIGWDLKQSRSRTAPQMFKLVPVELNKVKLVDALQGISALTEVPIHIDRFRLEARGTDIDEIIVSYPAKKTSWSLLMRGITTPHKLTRKFRIDETGQPFVWITAFVPSRPAK